jgi:eukaryotic-like serine/threonine-protein kinase
VGRAPGDLVGTVVDGRYRLVAPIGTGATGVVYEAEHTTTGVRVALKLLEPAATGENTAARFRREGKAMSLFHHRNIVELLDVGATPGGEVYLAVELVRGVSLRAVIDDGVVGPQRALPIVRQILDALAHAHAMGVIHRDVKPENIMLADGGAPDGADLVKMLDFGVAKLMHDTAFALGESKLTSTGFACIGTPLYIAPESVLGLAVDGRADLYAVGAILFEMLTGAPPFDAEEAEALLRLHTAAPVPSLRDRAPDASITPQLEFVIANALAKKPEHRFVSAADMAAAVDAALRSYEVEPDPAWVHANPTPRTSPAQPGETLVCASPPIPPPAPPVVRRTASARIRDRVRHRARDAWTWARRHKRITAPAAGFAALLLAFGVVVWSRGGGAAPPDGAVLASRAAALTATAPADAVELLERELVGPPAREAAEAYLALGHARTALGRRLDALAAYDIAAHLAPRLGADATLRANVAGMVDDGDIGAGIVALELLASRVVPPARDVIASYASTGKVLEVRHRALAIATRDGFSGDVDRIASWSLDLGQLDNCAERIAVVHRLEETGDRRALPALQKARRSKCLAREAADAIARLDAPR